MRNIFSRTASLAAAAVILSLAACETKEQTQSPGALPRAQGEGDVEPRLSASTYVAHGHLLERQGNLEQAVAQYRRALELTPQAHQARTRLGIVLNRLGRHADATATFRELVKRQPTAAQAYNNLGFSLFLEGHTVEAEQMLARATELDPAFRRAHMNRALALAKLKRYGDALAAFRLAGSEADAYYNLAVVQAEAGLYADAARALEQALIINPDFTAARQDLRTVSRMAAAHDDAAAEQLAPVPTLTNAAIAGSGHAPAEPPAATPPPSDLATTSAVETPPPAPAPTQTETSAPSKRDATTISAQIRAMFGYSDTQAVPPELRYHDGILDLLDMISAECHRLFLSATDRSDAWVRVLVLLNEPAR